MADSVTQSGQSLRERQSELTRRLIVDTAVSLLVDGEERDLAIRSVAAAAGMSERTIFRHFSGREDLLDAVADEMKRRQDHPPLPSTLAGLDAYVPLLFSQFEANAALIQAALRTEVYDRIRSADLVERGAHIRMLIERELPDGDERERSLVAANIHYHLIASTWHYYRRRFGFSAEETVAAARLAIATMIAALK